MKKLTPSLLVLALLFSSSSGFGFGHKKMQVTEIRGHTEMQIAKGPHKASVMVRGKTAELLYRMMREQHPAKTNTAALKMVRGKGASHWIVKGKQVSCSRITNTSGSIDDYACAFELDSKGNIDAVAEPYNPGVFNLAKTETGSKIFKKKGPSRGLASISGPGKVALSKGDAYLMYDEPGQKKKSEDALIVFRGDSAKELMSFLEAGAEARKHTYWGGAKGVRGREFACVTATKKEPERCALVVTLKDGSISRSGNPLLH